MALDGIVLSCIRKELEDLLAGGKIDRITQPEKDEVVLAIRKGRDQYRLLLSAQASMPRLHLTEETRKNPIDAPTFCMLLRKHIGSGKILGFRQPGLERILEMEIEHTDELGDLGVKTLVMEVMGRHSNLILKDGDGRVLDSAKRISHLVSSVRQVYPGVPYQYPPSHGKTDPTLPLSAGDFRSRLEEAGSLGKGLLGAFNGFSPSLSTSLCLEAGLSPQTPPAGLEADQWQELHDRFSKAMELVRSSSFQPAIHLDAQGNYLDFHVLPLQGTCSSETQPFESPSRMLETFYDIQGKRSRILQKSADLRKLVQNNLDRCGKKLELQQRQLEDTRDLDRHKIQGELITSNAYAIPAGSESVEVYDYYQDTMTTLRLDPRLTPIENAQKAFAKYNKKKRTALALDTLLQETRTELDHLESIKYALDFSETEEDLREIRNELVESGYLKRRHSKRKQQGPKAQPLHFLSSDGFHLYVGKNNLQNEALSMKFANGGDWWFHAKGLPGSHVILKSNGQEVPDRAFEEAAALAAHYSKAEASAKVAVDYTLKKNLKKPAGSPPGFVIYHTNYSMVIEPSVSALRRLQD
ncbi:Rqc2 family fibronectin-binding protein [Anaerotalea alkaliphila]|uniref:Rqc2 homolog RqcH n=1 Tax=Anaerotalea alkaliphila TaxID=2662126 RepID=A0A7X5HTR9_9FIRM|nr:NFACT RNA binding domain-containing protein [Anaerotalea alkaliphila]NDL66266.1 fibronectin/fibrinogen-binding protein [Anaerotalea alkaliphila]